MYQLPCTALAWLAIGPEWYLTGQLSETNWAWDGNHNTLLISFSTDALPPAGSLVVTRALARQQEEEEQQEEEQRRRQ